MTTLHEVAREGASSIVVDDDAPSTFAEWPRPLRRMRLMIERLHNRGDWRAWPLHCALAVLAGRPSFAREGRR
jgi:hypothetical protein